MTKSKSFIVLRWPTLATLALCALLPGCPMTDNYFIDLPSGGTAQMVISGGASEVSGAPSVVGGSDGGGYAGGPQYHVGPDPVGGGGTDHGTGMPDAGSNDAGGSDAGNSSSGGTGGSGGLVSMGGKPSGGSGGSASGGSSNGGNPNGGMGAAGWPSNWPQPGCADGVGKGDACGSAPQLCYKGCGPDNVGYKQLSCQLGTYQESGMGGCTFPTPHDYSCYAIPPSRPSACPPGVPRGGSSCQIATCTVCFGGTINYPQYQDSTGAQKDGYCVCSEAGVWTCGTRPESWPCPGPGCQCPGPGCQ